MNYGETKKLSPTPFLFILTITILIYWGLSLLWSFVWLNSEQIIPYLQVFSL